MKVIDLLNKIANGEEVPKKITQYCKCFDEIKYWKLCAKGYGCYEADDIEEYLFDYLTTDMLNDEVEIIEEDNKIYPVMFMGESEIEKLGMLKDKINEIIDKLNEGE